MTEYLHITPAIRSNALVATLNDVQLRDATTCYALRDEMVSAIDAARLADLVLDLRAVEFIGSVGFLAFLGARRHLTGGRVILCGMNESVRELFRVCALISRDPSKSAPFEEAESVESALAVLADS